LRVTLFTLVRHALVFLFLALPGFAWAGGYANLPLSDKTTDLFTVALPKWEVEKEDNLGINGKIKLKDPQGTGRFVTLSWDPGEVPIDQLIPVMTGLGLTQLPSVTTKVMDRNVALLRFINKENTKQLAVSSWYCKKADTTVVLYSFIGTDWDETVALHQRVLSTIRCNTSINSKSIKTVVPKFVPPRGYTKIPVDAGSAYAGPQDTLFLFSNAQPTNQAVKNGKAAQVLFDFLYKVAGLTEIVQEEKPLKSNEREVWPGTAKNSQGRKVHVMGTWWECPEAKVGFVGIYIGEPDPIQSNAMKTLTSAQCP